MILKTLRYVALLILIVNNSQVHATTIIVSNNEDDGIGSLRNAIDSLANSGDTIIFSPSIFGDTIRLSSGEIIINKNLYLKGAISDSILISGSNLSRIFTISATDTIWLSDISLLHGFATDSGGAIYNSGKLTITNCQVLSNQSDYGGGIANQGDLSVNNSSFYDNSASEFGGAIGHFGKLFTLSNSIILSNSSVSGGGGLAFTSGSGVSITDSRITGNISDFGGGIISFIFTNLSNSEILGNQATNGDGGGIQLTATAKIINCNINNNSVTKFNFSGGGIANYGNLTLINCTVDNNISSGNAGGVFSDGTSLFLNSTISSNASERSGGGLYNSGSSQFFSSTVSGNQSIDNAGGIMNTNFLRLEYSTIGNNAADSSGGGIWTSDSLIFVNTIVGNNTSNNGGVDIHATGASTVISEGYNLVSNINNAGFTPTPNVDIVGNTANPVDPLFEILTDNGGATKTHALKCGSPAIDKGANQSAPSTDQRGLPRTKNGIADMGSYETQFDNLSATPVISDESSVGATDGSISLVVTGAIPPYNYNWSTGDSSVGIASLSAGIYLVTVTDFLGCNLTANYTVGVSTSINTLDNPFDLSLYPVPLQDYLHIKISNQDAAIEKVKIFNSLGQVLKENLTGNFTQNVTIELTNLSAGFYWLLVDVKYSNQTYQLTLKVAKSY